MTLAWMVADRERDPYRGEHLPDTTETQLASSQSHRAEVGLVEEDRRVVPIHTCGDPLSHG